MRTPKLVPINLKKPKLNKRSVYLVCVNDLWITGSFSREWFGWSFNDDSGCFHQLDGEDGSEWQGIFRIRS